MEPEKFQFRVREIKRRPQHPDSGLIIDFLLLAEFSQQTSMTCFSHAFSTNEQEQFYLEVEQLHRGLHLKNIITFKYKPKIPYLPTNFVFSLLPLLSLFLVFFCSLFPSLLYVNSKIHPDLSFHSVSSASCLESAFVDN